MLKKKKRKGFIVLSMMFLLLYQFLSMKLASVNPMFYDFGMDLDGLMLRPEVKKLGKSSSSLHTYPFPEFSLFISDMNLYSGIK